MSAFLKHLTKARQEVHHGHSAKRLLEILNIAKKHDIQNGLTPENTVKLLEDLGPTFVKLGQIASTHPDMLPLEYCEAFSSLRANVDPMTAEVARAQVEEQLGKPIDELFSEFDDKPIGSASIAQVHRAVLREEGVEVALKVQRPGICETVAEDLAIMEHLVNTVELFSHGTGSITFKELVSELERTSHEELDFTIEAGNLDRFWNNNAARENVASPRFFEKYSGHAILCEEFAPSPRVGVIETLDLSEQEREDLGYLIARNYMAQILTDGFFHADPHAGNILITSHTVETEVEGAAKDAVEEAASGAEAQAEQEASMAADGEVRREVQYGIEWIDFGMMGTLSSREREVLMDLVKALVKNDAYKMKHVMLQVATPKEDVDHGHLLDMCESMLEQYANSDLESFDTGALINTIMDALKENHYEIKPFLVTLGRGLMTLEGTLHLVSSKVNVMAVLTEFMQASFTPDYFAKEIKKFGGATIDSMEAFTTLPSKAQAALDMLQKGQLKMNMTLDADAKFAKKLSHTLDNFSLVIIAAALFLGSCVLCMTNMKPTIAEVPVLGFLGFIAGIILMLMVIWRIINGGKMP